MKMKQVFYAAFIITLVQLTGLQTSEAQYYFERHLDSYVRVDEGVNLVTSALHVMLNGVPVSTSEDFYAHDSNSTGDQPVIATSTSSASTASLVTTVSATTNTQMTFNPDLVANGQVSGLAMNTANGSFGSAYTAGLTHIESTSTVTKASTEALFTLRNDQLNPPSTQVKLKIKQNSSFTADPAFDWNPEHYFEIYKNNPGTPPNVPLLSSSTAGEVILIDPVANPGDYYFIKGYINAKGGVFKVEFMPSPTTYYLGSLSVTGEAEVSVGP